MNSLFIASALAILGSSFWGSVHCAAMCGPVASLMSQRNSMWSYHLGRGLSYTLAGAIGGYLGSFFLESEHPTLRLISGVVFAGLLIFTGVQIFRGKNFKPALKIKGLHKLYRPDMPPLVLGFLSLLLPCGWLYSYIFTAAATQSPLNGAGTMLLFWLGGLPALSSVSLVINKTMKFTSEKKQQIAGLAIASAGLYSLVNFYLALAQTPVHSCH